MDKKTRHAVLLAALFALTPDSRAATAIELAQQHNEQAIALHRQGDFAGAIRHYREALPAIVEYFGEGSVERARVLSSLADAQLAAAQYRDAEQSYIIVEGLSYQFDVAEKPGWSFEYRPHVY